MINHLPALEVIIPLLGAMLSGISFKPYAAFRIAIITIVISSIISIYLLFNNDVINYLFGLWLPNIGIEYKLTNLNKILLLFINFNLLFFLIFYYNLIEESILSYLTPKWQYLFFTLILFIHAGYLGVISTNDIFNLYVFIEISSLSSYILMSMGNHLKAPVGALYYLIFGSIGTTLILIAIGFLLALTGSLNFSVMHDIISRNISIHPTYNVIFDTAIILYILGALLKIAFFPIHFWRKKAYSYASPVLLIYLASIASTIGVYVLLKFIISIADYHILIDKITPILLPTLCVSILACSFIAMLVSGINELIFYGILLNIGYAILFLLIKNGEYLVFPMLIIDGVIKLGLFSLQSHVVSTKFVLNNDYITKIQAAIILICSIGLPLTPMFLIKFDMLKILFSNGYFITFVVVAISFVASIFYHYKIIKTMFSQKRLITPDGLPYTNEHDLSNTITTAGITDTKSSYIKSKLNLSLTFIIMIQFFLLFYFDKLLNKSTFL